MDDGRPGGVIASPFACSAGEVQGQEEGGDVFLYFQAVGSADGGVEGGVGGAELAVAGRFEGAIEVAQRSTVGAHDLPAQRAQLTRSVGHSGN